MMQTLDKQLIDHLIDGAPDAILVTNKDRQIFYVNRESCRFLGFRAEELIGTAIEELIPARCKKNFQTMNLKPFSYSEGSLKREEYSLAVLQKNNKERAVTVSMEQVNRDFTVFRLSEPSKASILSAYERNLSGISKSIHDSIGQDLTALRMGLKSIHIDPEEENAIARRLDSIDKLASKIAEDIHYLSSECKPQTPDDSPLSIKIGVYIRSWSTRTEIPTDFLATVPETLSLDEDFDANLYRITQAVLKVFENSQAIQRLALQLKVQDSTLTIVVQQKGFLLDLDQLEVSSQSPLSLVLEDLRSRVALFHGDLSLESKPDSGTTIIVSFPVEKNVL